MADEVLSKKDKLLKRAKKRLKIAIDADKHNRDAAIEDLKFLNGNQWSDEEKKQRSVEGRPALQIDQLGKFVDQVVGDQRQNRPRIKVRPVSSGADIHLAKIRQGLISNIWYLSSGDSIIDQSFSQTVEGGYGAWRVLTRYSDDNPFVQEIYLEPLPNPFLVWLDPTAKDICYADAKFGFVLTRMPRDEFEERYPKATVPGEPIKEGPGMSSELFFDDNHVTVAEYFERQHKTVVMCQMSDGTVLGEEDARELIKAWEKESQERINQAALAIAQVADGLPPPAQGQSPQQPPQQPPGMGPPGGPSPKPEVVKRRETEEPVIKHFTITQWDILEGGEDGKDFPGKYIPLVILKGKERNVEGKTFVRSLIRTAKDPQRLVNYWTTAAAEAVALAPKAQWVMTKRQVEGYEEDYAQANTSNLPYLLYNPDGEAPPPQRQQPPNPPVAIFAQIGQAKEAVKDAIGMYEADVGQAGNERSGAALLQRQKAGDTATYAFMDNLSRAIAHTGRIINEMIPFIYDTERDIRLRNVDDTETFVPVNTTAESAIAAITSNPERYQGLDKHRLIQQVNRHGRGARYNDITAGKYDVIVETGPSYATARQEAAENLLRLVQAAPKQMAVALDMVAENLDFNGADELAQRLRKQLPPGMVKPKEGEPPQTPMPPSPQMIVMQKKLELEDAKIQIAREKVQVEKLKVVNQLQESKGEIKQIVFEIMAELEAAHHPADEMMHQ